MKIVSNHFKYASNVWLTSAFLTPCFFGFIIALFDGGVMETPMIIGLAIFFGTICSIPNYLIFLFLVWKINTAQLANTEKKIIINFIGVILTIALFMLIFHQPNGVDKDGVYFGLAYSLTISFGIWIFNLNQHVPEPLFEKKRLPRIKILDDILDDEIY